LPANNPWRGLPNVILTPHIGWNTPEANRRSVEIALDNLVGALTGEPVNVVHQSLQTRRATSATRRSLGA
jgi:phosphoglycerate dehydrogenase-like enzyme